MGKQMVQHFASVIHVNCSCSMNSEASYFTVSNLSYGHLYVAMNAMSSTYLGSSF